MKTEKQLFEKCIEIVLKHEGKFQANPNDYGNWVGGYGTGKLVGTKYGIAAKYFPDEDIPNLTIGRAKELYFERYWKPMRLFGIYNENIVLQIFDFGVNAGKHRAINTAQYLAYVKIDGVMGPITREAINRYDGDFLFDYIEERKAYYRKTAKMRDNHVFLKGWLNRVDSCHFNVNQNN